MFCLCRCLQRTNLHYVKRRGFSNTSSSSSPPNPIKKPPTAHSQSWASQFLSTKSSSDSEEKEEVKQAQEDKKSSNSNSSQQDDNAFIASLFSNKDWLSPKINWLDDLPSVEAINAKMAELYPQFTSQFKHLREGYEKMWDFLTMEDFRKLVDEINKDAKDPNKFPEISKDAVVREGNELSKEEQEFISKRKHFQKQAFAKFIGEKPENIDERDIPVVGLASSGGGYRAMIGLSSYVSAMKRSGALDCVMYFAGISGSCWTMVLYYNQLTKAQPEQLKTHFLSHVNTHWANVSNFINLVTSSPENSKLLLQGAIQRFTQQKGDISLVDIFGILIGGTLLSKKRTMLPSEKSGEDTTSTNEENTNVGEFHQNDMYLTGQQEFLKDGSEPMPIYCVVRHDITQGKSFEDRIKELKNKLDSGQVNKEAEIAKLEKKKEEIEAQQKDAYQWFEFTPYDMGCEEIEAWIPMWSFGRKFEEGKNIERLPEQTLDILMGMFGSAFAASLIHFYKEIKSFLPSGSLDKIDETIARYEASMSAIHPISPSNFPNPFYKISNTITMEDGKVLERPKAIVDSNELYLMDAGVDNNIPFFPLLREGRDVDIIFAMDLSADIQTATHFDRAESYIKRRGIKGLPAGSGWPKKDDSSEDKYPLGSCTIFEAEAKEEVTTAQDKKTIQKKRPVTLAYFPFIVNKAFDPDFDPQEEEFCSTWNFVYTPDQVEKVNGLAEANWDDNISKIKDILKKTWERKKKERLEEEESRIS